MAECRPGRRISSPSFVTDAWILDAVAGVLVELVKADLLPLRRGREQGYGKGHERQLEVALPARTRCHDLLRNKSWIQRDSDRLRSSGTLSQRSLEYVGGAVERLAGPGIVLSRVAPPSPQ